MNYNPLVIQYDILNNKWVFTMPNGVPNKRYTQEFKRRTVETMMEEGLRYSEIERRFNLPNKRSVAWKSINLEDGSEEFTIERRGRS